MIRFDALLVALLVVLAAASALGVISSQNEARKLRGYFEHEQNREHDLKVEWDRLQLEQSTLTAHRRVEDHARTRLGMVAPQAQQIIMLEGGGL